MGSREIITRQERSDIAYAVANSRTRLMRIGTPQLERLADVMLLDLKSFVPEAREYLEAVSREFQAIHGGHPFSGSMMAYTYLVQANQRPI